jgi:nitrogen fixation protein FixH
MNKTKGTPLTGRKVALMMCSAFAVIIGVNLTLAYKAVATFPGLEVKNSYVASQHFDADRAAQRALGWKVSARIEGEDLRLVILERGEAIAPTIVSATFGRATHVADDQSPTFRFDSSGYVAPVIAGSGNWNLRLVAQADDGSLFRQRIIVETNR